MKYLILLTVLFSISNSVLYSKIDNDKFELMNKKYGTNYSTGSMTNDNNGTVYFISGDNNKNQYKQIYTFKDGEISKILGMEDFVSISDTIYTVIQSLYYTEGKLFIIANPHLFKYENNDLIRLTNDVPDNYIRDVLDMEYENNKLYFLINDMEIESIDGIYTTVIPYDKIAEYDGTNIKYYQIEDSVTSYYQKTATDITVKNDVVWFTFSSTPEVGGGLATFDGNKFDVLDLEYYNEVGSIFRPSDINFIEDDLFVSFEANNIKDPTADGFGGLVSYDFNEWNFFERSKLNENSNADIRSFLSVDNNNIWIASSNLININLQGDEVTQYKMSEIFNLPTNDYNSINSMSYDNSTNTLWFSTAFSGIGYIKDVTTSVEDTKSEITISTYPNPTSEQINITLNNPENISKVSVKIYNVNGELIKDIYNGVPINNVSYGTKVLTSGTYFIQIDTDFKTVTKKIQVIK